MKNPFEPVWKEDEAGKEYFDNDAHLRNMAILQALLSVGVQKYKDCMDSYRV